MNNPIIAILITTFLRDNLLYKTIQSIVDNDTSNCIILIADQGYNSSEKKINIDYYKSRILIEYYSLPFDSGLSMARNYLVQKASEMKIPYCLLSDDSIQFIVNYNFNPIIQFLELEETRGIVGFALENSKCPLEYLMEITPRGIKLSLSNEETFFGNIKLMRIDICRNIFLAKTNTLLNLWDEELKLGEHEMAFLEYKKRGYKVYWTNTYLFKKLNINTSNEYKIYRNRLEEYLKIVKNKLNIKGWVIYPKNNAHR